MSARTKSKLWTFTIHVLHVRNIPLPEGRIVQLLWSYNHHQGTTPPAKVDMSGTATFEYDVIIQQPMYSASVGDMFLHLGLQQVAEGQLPLVMDQLSLQLDPEDPLRGRLSLCSSKKLVFTLSSSIEFAGDSCLMSPKVGQYTEREKALLLKLHLSDLVNKERRDLEKARRRGGTASSCSSETDMSDITESSSAILSMPPCTEAELQQLLRIDLSDLPHFELPMPRPPLSRRSSLSSSSSQELSSERSSEKVVRQCRQCNVVCSCSQTKPVSWRPRPAAQARMCDCPIC